MPIRTAALLACFVAALVLARSLGYKTLASLLPFCLMGGVSAWVLWKHHRQEDTQKGVKQHKIIIAVSITMILFILNSEAVFKWIRGKHD